MHIGCNGIYLRLMCSGDEITLYNYGLVSIYTSWLSFLLSATLPPAIPNGPRGLIFNIIGDDHFCKMSKGKKKHQ